MLLKNTRTSMSPVEFVIRLMSFSDTLAEQKLRRVLVEVFDGNEDDFRNTIRNEVSQLFESEGVPENKTELRVVLEWADHKLAELDRG